MTQCGGEAMGSTGNLQRNIPPRQRSDFRLWFGVIVTLVFVAAFHAQSLRPVLILLGPPASGKSTRKCAPREFSRANAAWTIT